MADESVDESVEHAKRMFSIISVPKEASARLGKLLLRGCDAIATPDHIAITSRGVIPHITQDLQRAHRAAQGVYTALEDFIERAPTSTPPIFNFAAHDSSSPLRRFTALDDATTSMLGPRRVPPVECSKHNTHSAISIWTSVGFNYLSVVDYADAIQKLKPDMAVALVDIPYGTNVISKKRKETMTDRTSRWMLEQLQMLRTDESDSVSRTRLIAPLLPIPAETQRWYLEDVLERHSEEIDGLAIYDSICLEGLPETLQKHPILAFTEPDSPQKLLQEIVLGVDLFTIPFIGLATDAGIALNFSFPVRGEDRSQGVVFPLGIDMWSDEHETDATALSEGCGCYACSNHHKAYLRHLLNAKEMLGWTLLQLHNYKVLEDFFAGVRSSIANGTFVRDQAAFDALYEPSLPAKTGKGPRVRGYQFKSIGGGEAPHNPPSFRPLQDPVERLADENAEENIQIPPDVQGASLPNRTR